MIIVGLDVTNEFCIVKAISFQCNDCMVLINKEPTQHEHCLKLLLLPQSYSCLDVKERGKIEHIDVGSTCSAGRVCGFFYSINTLASCVLLICTNKSMYQLYSFFIVSLSQDPDIDIVYIQSLSHNFQSIARKWNWFHFRLDFTHLLSSHAFGYPSHLFPTSLLIDCHYLPGQSHVAN